MAGDREVEGLGRLTPATIEALRDVMQTSAFATLVDNHAKRLGEPLDARKLDVSGVAREMRRLREASTQLDFIHAFLAVMSVEDDGVRVKMSLTWPRPKKAAAKG